MSERDDRDTNIPPVDAATRARDIPAQDDAFLVPWFAEARAPVALSADLSARLMHDALAVQPLPQPAAPHPPSFWQRLAAALAGVGGAPGLATLGAAALGGVWIGVAVPEPAAGLVAHVWQGSGLVGTDVLVEAELADLSEDGGLLALIEGY